MFEVLHGVICAFPTHLLLNMRRFTRFKEHYKSDNHTLKAKSRKRFKKSDKGLANWHYDHFKKKNILDRALSQGFISESVHQRYSSVNQRREEKPAEGVFIRHWGELDDFVEELVATYYEGYYINKNDYFDIPEVHEWYFANGLHQGQVTFSSFLSKTNQRKFGYIS